MLPVPYPLPLEGVSMTQKIPHLYEEIIETNPGPQKTKTKKSKSETLH